MSKQGQSLDYDGDTSVLVWSWNPSENMPGPVPSKPAHLCSDDMLNKSFWDMADKQSDFFAKARRSRAKVAELREQGFDAYVLGCDCVIKWDFEKEDATALASRAVCANGCCKIKKTCDEHGKEAASGKQKEALKEEITEMRIRITNLEEMVRILSAERRKRAM